jgi:hypothetical protein
MFNIMTDTKERILQPGEYMFRDGTPAHFLLFQMEGKLRLEKEVNISS